jgi:hypothetical protein
MFNIEKLINIIYEPIQIVNNNKYNCTYSNKVYIKEFDDQPFMI